MDLSKFKFFTFKSKTGSDTVVAVATYAGKIVKCYAKCDPRDNFDLEDGKKLAAARCKERVALKRSKRAKQKLTEAAMQLKQAQKHYEKMNRYFDDSTRAHAAAQSELDLVLKNMQ